MDLIEHNEKKSNLINSINSSQTIINDQIVNETCIVSNNLLIKGLNLESVDKLTALHIEKLLSTNPELILIGSGSEHIFPDPSILGPIGNSNIGFEVMNNLSASRTYNILVAEERQVSCLLIFNNTK